MKRYEVILLALFLACWAIEILVTFGLLRIDGTLPLTLYPYYSTAMSLGWLFGLLYVQRTRNFDRALRRRFALLYIAGPAGILFLLRDMAPLTWQNAAPMVPLYGLGVFLVFFVVPVIFRVPVGRGR